MANVKIEEEKYNLLKLRAEEKGFDSTEEYIDHLLDQIVEKIKKEDQEREYSEEQEEEVKEKLEQLGYMD
jgi:flagellar biosynthesis/type III secretory pathway protein FliH